MPTNQSAASDAIRKIWSLYPNGFSSSQLIDAIEREAVWEGSYHLLPPARATHAKEFVSIFRRSDNGYRWIRVKKSYSGRFFPAVV